MKIKPLIWGTLAYSLVTFTVAVTWHLMLFEDKYRAFGYFRGDPNVALGFLAIILQGLILSFLYPRVALKGKGAIRGVKYSLLVGIFFWTSHVLAFLAKNLITDPLSFLIMESFFLLIQFGAFGILIGLIYANQFANSA